jgi:hypothetical protein
MKIPHETQNQNRAVQSSIATPPGGAEVMRVVDQASVAQLKRCACTPLPVRYSVDGALRVLQGGRCTPEPSDLSSTASLSDPAQSSGDCTTRVSIITLHRDAENDHGMGACKCCEQLHEPAPFTSRLAIRFSWVHGTGK